MDRQTFVARMEQHARVIGLDRVRQIMREVVAERRAPRKARKGGAR